MGGRGACAGWGARCALFVCLAAATPMDGAAQIVGRVMDRGTRAGVTDASVLLLTVDGEPVAEARTDSAGVFTFIPTTDSATFTLQVVANGTFGRAAEPVVYRGTMVRPLMILDSRGPLDQPVSIDGVEVTVDQRDLVLDLFGFYDRRDRGYGTFLEAEDFADEPTDDLTMLIRNVPGVDVRLNPPRIQFQRNLPRRSDRYCVPSIWVNGIPDYRLEDQARDEQGFFPGESVNDFLPGKDEIAGIEVYRSRRSVPRELQIEAERLGARDASEDCGVIMLWTHSRSVSPSKRP